MKHIILLVCLVSFLSCTKDKIDANDVRISDITSLDVATESIDNHELVSFPGLDRLPEIPASSLKFIDTKLEEATDANKTPDTGFIRYLKYIVSGIVNYLNSGPITSNCFPQETQSIVTSAYLPIPTSFQELRAVAGYVYYMLFQATLQDNYCQIGKTGFQVSGWDDDEAYLTFNFEVFFSD